MQSTHAGVAGESAESRGDARVRPWIVRRAAQSGNPSAELTKQLTNGGLAPSRRVGAAVGAACLALIWMAA